jgi:hypothetical protein
VEYRVAAHHLRYSDCDFDRSAPASVEQAIRDKPGTQAAHFLDFTNRSNLPDRCAMKQMLPSSSIKRIAYRLCNALKTRSAERPGARLFVEMRARRWLSLARRMSVNQPSSVSTYELKASERRSAAPRNGSAPWRSQPGKM